MMIKSFIKIKNKAGFYSSIKRGLKAKQFYFDYLFEESLLLFNLFFLGKKRI